MAVKTKRHQFSDDEEDENLDELEMDNEDLFADEEVGESPGEDEDEDEAKEMSDGDEEGVAPSDKLAEVADLLATEVGVKLPDDVTEEDLVEKLHGALVAFKHAKEYHEGGEKAAEMSEDEGDEGDDGGLGLELSDEDELDGLDEDEEAKAKAKEKAEKEPMTLQMSRRLDNQSRRLAIAEKQLAEERLSKFKFFIGRLVREGRVSPKVAQDWQHTLSARQMSLASGDDPRVRRVLDQIELAKTTPRGTFWTRRQKVEFMRSAKRPGKPDYVDFSRKDDSGVDCTPAQAKKILDQVYGRR